MHWPGFATPVPHVWAPAAWRVAEDALAFGDRATDTDPSAQPWGRPKSAFAELTDEFYLRHFLPLDTSDAMAVADFCAQYGPVGLPDHSDLPRNVQWPPVAPLPSPWNVAEDADDPADSLEQYGVLPEALPCFVERVQRISGVAVYQGVLRNLTLLWWYVSGAADDAQIEQEWAPVWHPTTGGKDSRWTPDRAVAVLGRTLSPALTPFHVQIGPPSHNSPFGRGRPVNVYAAMCLQLANHIAGAAPYQQCAECGKLFVRKQDPRYRMGQRRAAGSRFCTATCENRYHQRRHRQRQRERRHQKTGEETA